jgi:hypothetical protein
MWRDVTPGLEVQGGDQIGDFVGPDDLIGDEDVGDTSSDQSGGLAHLGKPASENTPRAGVQGVWRALAHVAPQAPAAMSFNASSGLLRALQCGRHATLAARMRAAICSMFFSNPSRSMVRQGVGSTPTPFPTMECGANGPGTKIALCSPLRSCSKASSSLWRTSIDIDIAR